jgi:hypothetical protein
MAFFVRFIPYVGPWLGAILPVAFSVVFFDGWWQPLMVMGLFTTVELVSNMIMEPMLYGQSAGVSEVALLVALAFWTWVWGPIGLALATPLTVCLVVLCKHIPELEFVELIMGDEEAVDSPLVFYQRLLAMDATEAEQVLQAHLKEQRPESVFDEVLIPALNLAKRDASREKLTAAEIEFIYATTRELVQKVELPKLVLPGAESELPRVQVSILGCPAHDEADEIALAMLGRLLDPERTELEIVPSEILSSEVISRVREKNPSIICVGSLDPDPVGPIRYLCKRMRERYPSVRILVGRWGASPKPASERDQLIAAGADYVSTSLIEAHNQLTHLMPIAESEAHARQQLRAATIP